MSGLNVKNTIVERVLQIVAPHPCLSCGKIGGILCPYCKYDIGQEQFGGCILCEAPSPVGVCARHDAPFECVWVVGERSGTLQVLIDALKFQHVKAAAPLIAELLDDMLPVLPSETVVIPVPTVASHVRERGYDQALLIAKELAVLRGFVLKPALKRASKTTQHIVGRQERQKQAQVAFTYNKTVDVAGKTVLLVDDVITTGATVTACAALLSAAGARVLVAGAAYQTKALDFTPRIC